MSSVSGTYSKNSIVGIPLTESAAGASTVDVVVFVSAAASCSLLFSGFA